MSSIEWKPIFSAPEDTVVLLTGNSGMLPPHDSYITSGYKNQDYHKGCWNNIQGDFITDQFSEPTHWAKIPNLP